MMCLWRGVMVGRVQSRARGTDAGNGRTGTGTRKHVLREGEGKAETQF